MNPITHRNREIERLERELAEKDAQITKLTAQLRVVKHSEEIHQEQHAQSRENAKLLYTTLRSAAPDVLKSIEGALWQNTSEYDKLMSEGRRWQEKCQRSERELTESREECRRLREFATKMTKINFQVANYANFEVQWYAALRTFKEIREQANVLLAPKVRRGE